MIKMPTSKKHQSFVLFVLLGIITVSFFGCKSSEKKDNYVATEFELSDEDWALLDTLQYQTFQYFWEGAEPVSGMARERFHEDDVYPTSPKDVVTTGGSGFGLMAILVGIERGFITREEGFERFKKIVSYLEKADRFHGVWPHWLNGPTGKVYPFSAKDDGGDIVETSFLMQGLLTVEEYFRTGSEEEQHLANRIDALWKDVEWDWYTQGGQDVLYWHWSPTHGWEMNFAIGGYNECLITYILAVSSPTHGIPASAYHKGWARDGKIVSHESVYGIPVILDYYEHDTASVGPLFWAHYSYLGLNPMDLKDDYAQYWDLNQNLAKIHHEYAIKNPMGFKGYGDDLWGLTSSYSIKGYAGHRPGRDIGVISPTAALSSFPYTPEASMKMIRHLYHDLDQYIGEYGPYDAFSLEEDWYLPRYLAIDQGPIPVMIENYRTGLCWKLFMKNEDLRGGLQKLGFLIHKD